MFFSFTKENTIALNTIVIARNWFHCVKTNFMNSYFISKAHYIYKHI